ncbi:MAG: response regulator transcription factor [Meiothermus sp.]|nr:response regulator transcription factor [Meiothermus sp.]
MQLFSRSSLVKANLEALAQNWRFERGVTLVLDYPAGFALEVLPMLEPPVVIVTPSLSPYYWQNLIDHGPSALLTEPAAIEAALTKAATGQPGSFPAVPADQRLTPREREVLGLLVKGMSDKEIARELGLEPKTVSHWVLNIRGKMGAENRAQAILIYWGLLPGLTV